MLVLDVSGSMKYRGDQVGKFSDVYDMLDKDIVYVYKDADTLDAEDTLANSYYFYYSTEKGYWIRANMKSGSKTQTMPNRATGYVYYSRIYQAQEALERFVNAVASQSPESMVGLVTFAETVKSDYFAEMSETNRAALIDKINAMTVDGGTSPNEGLDKAYTTLKQYEDDGRKKYVILFTDGEPTGDGDTWRDSVADATAVSADRVKTIGEGTDAETTVYTIALSPSEKAKEWLEDSVASSGCAISINEMSSLESVFGKIVDEISNYVDIEDATVVDILAAEFELTETGKTQLKSSGATWEVNTDGTTTIIWDNVTISCSERLSYSFEVKAKEAFLGGNNVCTNGSASAIYANNAEYKLPLPIVNVKATVAADDLEKTIFLGDTVPMSNEILKAMSEYTQNSEYVYKWYTDEACTQEISEDDIAAETPGTEGASYFLKVSYVSEKPEKEALTNTDGHYVGEGTTGYSVYEVGTYQINVVDGTITIQKTISKSTIRSNQGDPIFTFKISDGNRSYYRTVRFSEAVINNASSDAVTLTATLTGLAKGSYTVEELETSDYSLASMTVDGSTTFDYARTGSTVTFTVGDINKRYGKVSYVNVRKDNTTPKDKDVVKNTLKVGSKITDSKDGDN
jgi:hypothetical protein